MSHPFDPNKNKLWFSWGVTCWTTSEKKKNDDLLEFLLVAWQCHGDDKNPCGDVNRTSAS